MEQEQSYHLKEDLIFKMNTVNEKAEETTKRIEKATDLLGEFINEGKKQQANQKKQEQEPTTIPIQ